jgi:hypothetical protein
MQIVLVVTIDGVEELDYLSLAVVRLSVKLQHGGWGSQPEQPEIIVLPEGGTDRLVGVGQPDVQLTLKGAVE